MGCKMSDSPMHFTDWLSVSLCLLSLAAKRLFHFPESTRQEQAFQGPAERCVVLYRPEEVQFHGGAGGTLQKGSYFHQ